MDIRRSKDYLKQLLSMIRNYCQDNTPLPFLMGAALVYYYSKMVKGYDDGGTGYKEFIINYMQKVRKRISNIYIPKSLADKLPDQMWHVMRCGLIHTFSLFPDKTIRNQLGRDRSIVLCHKKEATTKGLSHLSHYSGPTIWTLHYLWSKDFIDDLIAVNDLIFDQASSDSVLKSKIEKWLKQCPPISGGF